MIIIQCPNDTLPIMIQCKKLYNANNTNSTPILILYNNDTMQCLCETLLCCNVYNDTMLTMIQYLQWYNAKYNGSNDMMLTMIHY